MCDGGVGIHIVAVAGEVFDGADQTATVHGADHGLGICRRFSGGTSEGAVIDEIFGACGHIADRCVIEIDAKIQKKSSLFLGVPADFFQSAFCIQGLRIRERFLPELREFACAHHSAALFVCGKEKRQIGDAVPLPDGIAQGVRRAVFKIHGVEGKAAELIGGNGILGAFLRTADNKKLPDFFFDRHACQNLFASFYFVHDSVLVSDFIRHRRTTRDRCGDALNFRCYFCRIRLIFSSDGVTYAVQLV